MLVKKAWQQGYEEAASMFTMVRKREEVLAILSSFSSFCTVMEGGGAGMRISISLQLAPSAGGNVPINCLLS